MSGPHKSLPDRNEHAASASPNTPRVGARLIAIEGIDGSGKGTQAQRLVERLRDSGRKVQLVSFPRYEATFFGGLVGSFLNGKFGALDEVHPLLVSLLFAGDRFESRHVLDEALASCDMVVLDRFVASNVAHQGAKVDGAERDALCRSIEHVEFDLFGMRRPDRVILLDLSVAQAQELVAQKAARKYTDRAADIQEADGEYLSRVRELYLELAQREPNWSIIHCDRPGDEPNGVRSIEELAEEIWQLVGALPR
jgi:dTMP kinase